MPKSTIAQRIALTTLFAFACVLTGCMASSDRTGSETHWLAQCGADKDCGGGECLCGVCVDACESGSDCGSSDECSLPGSLAFDTQCAPRDDAPSNGGVCLPECERRCGEGELCADGACVVAPEGANVECDGGDCSPMGPTRDGSVPDGPEPEGTGDTGPEPEGTTPGGPQPGTSNAVFDVLRADLGRKVDLLFVVDNSLSMGDKQALFAQALPDLVARLVDPLCVSDSGDSGAATEGQCPAGYTRAFQPVEDIHVGVISSSLGGFGAALDCSNSEDGDRDNAHLMGSLPRVQAELPGTPPFLTWCMPGSSAELNGQCSPTPESGGGNSDVFVAAFQDQVQAVNEFGCGWEATLESWMRFLVEPYPWTSVVRQNCPFGGDTNQLCVGPETDATGVPYIDTTLLEQRKAFLRPDSLLAIMMLTDENDCSFKASGQSWRLSETQTPIEPGSSSAVPNTAYKGSAACATDPNGECCTSCGLGAGLLLETCATATNAEGDTVLAGCEEPRYPSLEELAQAGSSDPTEDAVNLRCFNQKQRFGVDYLYPTVRYSNALTLFDICPFTDSLDPNEGNASGQAPCTDDQLVQNPLYIDLTFEDRSAADPNALPIIPRDSTRVFLAGIVGVPWQDLAVDPAASTLEYRSAVRSSPNPIDWKRILGSDVVGEPYDAINSPPTDPLMLEQIDPRSGTDTSVNGGEWNILDRDDLQYACTFPLNPPVECPDINDTGAETVTCDCTYYGGAEYQNPLCSGNTQTHSKAYPSTRILEVLRDVGDNAVVASVCAKETQNPAAADFGYRPAIASLVDRMTPELAQQRCLASELPVDEQGNAQCRILEAAIGQSCTADARSSASSSDVETVRGDLRTVNVCEDVNGDCELFDVCEVDSFAAGDDDFDACLTAETATGNGWCYVDPANGLGDEGLVAGCGAGEKRRIRFVGSGQPRPGTVSFLACD